MTGENKKKTMHGRAELSKNPTIINNINGGGGGGLRSYNLKVSNYQRFALHFVIAYTICSFVLFSLISETK